MVEHHSVIVIGSGISGLSAAQELANNNSDYLILEARNRIGGRIHTDRSGLTPYDLGASWAHDTLSNKLFDKIVENGPQKYGLYFDDQKPLLFSKTYASTDFENGKIEQVVKEIEKFIELKYFEEIDKEDVCLKNICDEYMNKHGKLLTDFQKMFAPQLLRGLELWHGIGWDQMSSKFGLVDNVGRNCLFTNGYDLVINDILDDLDQSKIKLNSPVIQIDRIKRRKDNLIELKLKNGDQYTCEHLICTVPQSILQLYNQEGGIEWIPKLPSTITDSLDNMSWGKLGKVIFEFDEAWWKHLDTDRFVAISEPNIDNNDDNHQLPPTWSYPVLILNYYKSKKIPALLCFTQGELTEYVECNPEKAWDHMKPILKRLSELKPGSNFSEPKRTIVTDWTVNPYSLGSYAACEPNNDPTDLVIQLSKGLDNIRFAGEHTILDGAGAVHGAWMSGKIQSRKVLVRMGVLPATEEDEDDNW